MMGLDPIEWTIALFSLAVMIIVELINDRDQTSGGIRTRIASLSLPLRWVIWFALIFYCMLLGEYGPGYSAAEFIYRGF